MVANFVAYFRAAFNFSLLMFHSSIFLNNQLQLSALKKSKKLRLAEKQD